VPGNQTPPGQEPPPTLWQVAQSVAAAFFGVQSEQNRQRDFTRGKPGQFIIIGLIATALFVLLMVVIVRLVLRFALP
jgi:hypothetical protein